VVNYRGAARLGTDGVVGCRLYGGAVDHADVRLGQPHPLPIVQSLTPYLLVAALPIAALANWRRSWTLAIVSGLVGVGTLVLLVPVTMATSSGSPGDPASITVIDSNVLVGNPSQAEAAEVILAADADLIVLSEFEPLMREMLSSQGADERYPYRELHDIRGTEGMGVYSKFPLSDIAFDPVGTRPAIQATVSPDGLPPMRLIAVHPLPPIALPWRLNWASDVAKIGELGRTSELPTMVIGDFNASYFHPDFRRVLKHYTDVHQALGKGLSTSWPADEFMPPFVRLDHALVRNGLVPIGVRDIWIPGSDHVAFVATVAIHPST
jgi:endonuclease/exonuclease/phosphatase (EEP) superfamily protein YafD